MKLHLNLSLRRALLAAMAAVATFAPSATAGVMHSDATYQTYTDFGQNCGRYVVGSKVNALLSHIRNEAGGITIDYTDGNDSYVISNEQGMISFNATHDGGHSTAIGPNFLATVRHNGSLNASFSERTVGSNYALNYEAIDINNTTLFRLSPEWYNGKYDYMLQRQSKIVTDVSWNPITTLTNEEIDNLDGGLVYHSGAGMMYQWDDETQKATYLATGYRYIIGTINGITNGLIQNDPQHPDEGNLSVLQDPHYGQSGLEGASEQNPLPNAVRPGDSGSPVFIYNTETNQYEYIAAQQSIIEPSFGQARGNVVWTHETLSAFDSSIDMSTSGTIHLGAVSIAGKTISETLNEGKEDEVTYSTTLYSGIATDGNGNKTGEYIGVQTGVNTWCNLYDRRNIENWYAYQKKDGKGNVISDLQVSDEDLFYTQNLVFAPSQATNNIILDATVDLGIGYAEFNKGANMEKAVFDITAGTAGAMFNHAGYVINEGAEVHLKLVNPVVDETPHMTEWRKIGAGDLYIDGTGDTNALLNVGGSGKTYLQQTAGHAAYNVLVNSGATVIIDGINQIERDLTFGAGGGTLDLNGSGDYDEYNWLYNIDWYTTGGENRDGFTINALTEEAMITNSKDTVQLTYKQSGNTSYAGSFSDTASSALIVVYDGGSDSSWTLNSIHTNLSNQQSGFEVKSGTVILSGTNTVHGMGSATATNTNRLELENDWHYADATMGVLIDDGATFVLGSHARLKGQVVVGNGGTFVIREAVKHQHEYVEGGSSLEDTYQYADYYGYKGIGSSGDIWLYNNAALKIEYSEGTTANTTIDASIYGNGSVSVDAGISGGSLTLDGDNSSMKGTKTLISGGLIATGANSLGNTSTNRWKVQEKGWIASHAHSADELLAKIDTSSTGILALSENTANALLNLTDYNNLYIGAEAGKVVDYGTADATLEAVNGAWRLGGGGGTLNVNFKLDGTGDLIIGNDYSTGTVNLTNAANKINGDIIIMGSGNLLTYTTMEALGGARVALSYGNSLALHSQTTLSLLSDDAEGIMQLSESLNLDMTGYKVALGASGKQTYTGKITLGENDSYRFGGSGHLTLDTVLDESQSMILDGQSNSGSSVTFARENAFTGGHIIAMGGEKGNLSGSISVYAGHANSFADLGSMQLQKGATLYTDGYTSMTVQNLSASTGSSIRNSGSRDTALRLNITKDITTEIADGVLNDANNSAGLSLVKTGEGTLTMKGNRSWSGGLTIKEGTVAISAGNGGVGTDSNVINIEDDGILRVTANHVSYANIGNTIIKQKLTGTGTIEVANGKDMMLTQQAAGFEGTVHVTDNTRLYVGSGMSCDYDANPKYNTVQAFDDASIRVDSGSQVRITNSYYHVSSATVVSDADYFISGTGKAGTVGSDLVHEKLTAGALSIDCGSIITGSVTLEADATIASWSVNPAEECYNKVSPYYNNTDANKVLALNHSKANIDTLGKHYGVQGYLGGTIRGQILGQGKTLTIGGSESMTFTADSANTFGDLAISNGNGNNTDKFALCLDGGKAVSQTSTALGTGKVTLNEGLILRLAGTGEENQAHVVYTYGNDIDAGANATLQSHNITNKLTGTITFSDTLNLATAHGGVLELAGNIASNGTLNICENSHVVISGKQSFTGTLTAEAGAALTLGSSAILTENSTITGTDSLSIYLNGTEAYEIGSIKLLSSSGGDTTLNLNFDFTGTSDENGTWCTMSSAISATHVIIGLELNLFNELHAGEYTLISHTGNDITYSLADTMGDRLSLSSAENGVLTLIVGSGDYLYWTGKESSYWHADINWTSEKTGDTDFEAGAKVMLDSSGVATTDTSQTIILGSEVTEIDTLSTQEASYEILGEGELRGKSLLVGNKGDLKLSNTGGSSFSAGVQVNDGTLEVSGGAFAADVTAENGGRFTLSDNATMTGDIKLHQASGTIQNANFNGNIELRDADITVREATLTGELNLEYSTGSIQDSTVNGNILLENAHGTIQNSTIAGNVTTAGNGTLTLSSAKLGQSHTLGFDAGTLTVTSENAIIGGTFSYAEGQSQLQVQGMSIAGGGLSTTAALKVDTLNISDGSLELKHAAGTTTEIGAITGNGSLRMESAGNQNLINADVWGLTLLGGGTTTISGTVTLQTDPLYIGKHTLNLNSGANVTVSTLRVGDANNNQGNHPAQINIGTGASLTVTGSTDVDGTRNSFLLAHWGSSPSTLVLDGGTLTAQNTSLLIGWDSSGRFEVNSGTANLKGIRFTTSSGRNNADTLLLGSAKGGTGRINLGSNGITGIGSNDIVNLGNGTISATADFAISNKEGVTSSINLVGTSEGTVFDTNGHTITVNTGIAGAGNLIKTGAGVLNLAGSGAEFSGNISVTEGALALNATSKDIFAAASSVTIGNATLDLSAIDFSDAANAISLSNTMSLDETSTVAFGTLESGVNYQIFSFSGGTAEGWYNLGLSNFTINGVSLADMEHASLSLGMDGSFSYSMGWELTWNGSTPGTWTTASGNEVWLNSDSSAAGFCNGDSVTFESAATVTLGSDIMVSAMHVNSGTVVVNDSGNYAFNAGSVNVADGAALQIQYTNNNAAANNTLTKLILGNRASFSTYDGNAAIAATTIGQLQLNGASATVKDENHSGIYHIQNLSLKDGLASSLLNLVKQSQSKNITVFQLGSNSDAGNFAGTINLKSTATDSYAYGRPAAIILSNKDIAANAVINLESNTSSASGSVLALGINADNTTIAGLESGKNLGVKAKLFSGSIGTTTSEEWATGNIDNASTRTLTINTAEGGNHTFYGEVMSINGNKLNLVKDGKGTQSFLGSGSFGSVTVKGGTLTLGGSMTVDVSSNANRIFDIAENARLNISSSATFENTSNVNLEKTGAGTMTVNSKISQNWLDIRTGTFEVAYTGDDGNSISTIDAGMGGAATGQVLVKKGATLSSEEIWMKEGSIALEEGGTLKYKAAVISGESSSATAIIERTDKRNGGKYAGIGDANVSISNARVKYTGGNATISNKLTNSSVENAGGGVLTVTHTGNTLSGVVASAGDITLQNLAANTSLNLLEIAAGYTVNAYVGTNVDEKQGVSVASTGTALLSGGATLNTSLTLADGATLEMYNLTDDSSVTINGALTFNGQVKLGTKLLTAVNALTGWEESLTLFTGLAGGVSLPSTVATNADEMVRASEVFSNVTNGNLYVSYQVVDNVGSLMVINVPEPTTTTLSLLALSALAARRRRKN